MLKNYINTALRNMKRYKVFTLINIGGLSIGLAMCMLVIMIVSYQLQSDRYNSKHDRVYRVTSTHLDNSSVFNTYATVSLPMARELEENHTAVKQATVIRRGFGNSWVGDLDDPTLPVSGFFADENFLDMFELKLQSGDPETALSDPFSVVLTEDAAIKIYGTKNVLGEQLDMDEKGLYKVTGVLEDSDNITHLSYEALGSMSSVYTLETDTVIAEVQESWNSVTAGWVYVELREGAEESDVVDYMAQLNEEHYGDDPKQNYLFNLQGLTDIKPGPLMANEIGPIMPWLFVYILGGLGLVIMISSCFNYINLTIARGMNRSREIGVRKVAGASKFQVFAQFMAESMILCLMAFALAILFLIILEPAFAQLNFARILQWKFSHTWWVWAACLGFTILIGLVAGLFPALAMSSFRPIHILGNFGQVRVFSRTLLRKSLIIIQFTLSLVFIISIMILYGQVNMMMNAELGFDNDNILTLPYDQDTFEPINNELKTLAEVVNVSKTSHMPATGTTRGATLKKDQGDEDESVSYFSIDEYYLDNMGIELLSGRNISTRLEEQPESEVIINEEAVAYFGFDTPADAVGESVYTSDSTALTIVGVIPNYHHEALVVNIEPLALRYLRDSYSFIQVKLQTQDREQARAAVVDIWKKHTPGKTGRFMYMDDLVSEFYDIMFGDLLRVLMVVATIAVLIACLGLLGITIFSTQLKVKEISVRKVLGAGEFQLYQFLSKGFLILIGVSILAAVPISWFINKMWLEQIAYRIALNPLFFVAGSGIILLVALFTTGFQIWQVIRVNPAVSLRNE